VIEEVWDGCYDKSLKGFITQQSFGHPAKYSLGLIERVFDHCLKRGYFRAGDLVGDCFGGVAVGGLVAAYRGLQWTGVELEPKFVNWAGANINLHRSRLAHFEKPIPRIVQGDSRNFAEVIATAAGVVTSPPYAETIGDHSSASRSGDKKHRAKIGRNPDSPGSLPMEDYGTTSGQIGRLKSGEVDGVIASPPFAGTSGAGGGGINVKGYVPAAGRKWTGPKADPVGSRTYQGQGAERAPGNIETLKEGSVAGVISSPPYADIAAGAGGLNTKPASKPGQQSGRSASAVSQVGNWSKDLLRYGQAEGQIAKLKGGSVEGVVSSPPFEQSGVTDHKGQTKALIGKFNGGGAKFLENYTYGDSQGQIGKDKGETYWEAMAAVYRSCYQAIKPGGVLVLVLKDYVKAGQRVPLCDDSLKLLEHLGFKPLERIRAMLVKETVHEDLFGEATRETTSRKSFFRRLYEQKPGAVKIDFEEVLILGR
jgi:DNA modification methylase